jgi:hypothetical protein
MAYNPYQQYVQQQRSIQSFTPTTGNNYSTIFSNSADNNNYCLNSNNFTTFDNENFDSSAATETRNNYVDSFQMNTNQNVSLNVDSSCLF